MNNLINNVNINRSTEAKVSFISKQEYTKYPSLAYCYKVLKITSCIKILFV